MANHQSAIKQHRQSLKSRLRNRGNRSRMRTAIKSFRGLLASGEVETARGQLAATLSLIDRTARLGAIHTNCADRTKSRLTLALSRAAAS